MKLTKRGLTLVLVAGAVGLVISACGPFGAAQSVVSPKPKAAVAIRDSCLVGHWRSTSETVVETSGPDQANLTGGAGISLMVSGDGQAVMDFTGSQALSGEATTTLKATPSPSKTRPSPTPTSVAISQTQSGLLISTWKANGGNLTVVVIANKVRGVNLAQGAQAMTSYKCSGQQLQTVYQYSYEGNVATKSVSGSIVATIVYTRTA